MADWFRWWHGTVTDPKFMWVSRRAGRPLSEVIAVWAALLETASNAETRGNVSCFDSVSFDCFMGFEDGICDWIIATMTDKGMVDEDGNLTGWERRQPKREDQASAESRAKSSTERVREYRERMKQKRNETSETATKRSETQETARVDKSREEKEENHTAAAVTRISPVFEEAWSAYPKREGSNSKADALKQWKARVKAGVSESDLLAGVKRYAAFCDAKGDTGTQYVKQAKSFLGTGEYWAQEWAVCEQQPDAPKNRFPNKQFVGGLWVE